MTKSTKTERAKRVNAAVDLLKESRMPSEAVEALSAQYGISKRQAYRYVKEAESSGSRISVPDQKIAFTVKLSRNLILALRQYAKFKGKTLSEVVEQALGAFLYKGRRRGQAGENG
jgi:predicted DNA-binding transcriptional regulator YafY